MQGTDTCAPALPEIRFRGALWSRAELATRAAGWAGALARELAGGTGPVGVALPNRPDAVAVFLALSTLDRALALLPPDPRAWRSAPALPAGTPLVLPPGCEALGEAGEALGLRPVRLPERPPGADPGSLESRLLRLPGFVTFTSGSTGLPRPVYLSTGAMLRQAAATTDAYGLSPRARVAVSLPLSSHYGLGHGLILPLVLGGEMGLIEAFDPRSLLALFAAAPYDYWAGIPVMADLLSRLAITGPVPPVPPVCHISAGPLPAPVFRAFRTRFGSPLRPSYGRTETGFITAECGPPEEICPEAVGRPVPGVLLAIGDDPRTPAPAGQPGRIWLQTPWQMEGYGFPPGHRPGERQGGLHATEDVGVLRDDGRLVLLGRTDDCFKTAAGFLVAPAEIARALVATPGARDAVVVPMGGPSGALIGAVVEATESTGADAVLAGAATRLPRWLVPQRLIVTAELPRLASGKVDRRRCIAMLGQGAP